MKWIIYILSGLIATPALAVRSDECPQSIQIRLGNISAISVADIQKETNDAGLEPEEAKLERIRNALFNMRKYEKSLKLVQKSSEHCQYLPAGEGSLNGFNETRLVHKNGRDVLRIAIDLSIPGVTLPSASNEFAWIYLDLAKYSSTGVQIRTVRGARVMGWFDHGGPTVQFGWINEIECR